MTSERGQEREIRRLIDAIVVRRSHRAADKLVRAYYPMVYRSVFLHVMSREEAENLTQETFIAALRALESYDAGKGTFATWLLRIASNKVIDSHRRTRPVVSLESSSTTTDDNRNSMRDELPDVRADPYTTTANIDLLHRVERFITSEDERSQTVYRMRLYGQRSFQDIAAALDMPEPAVKARYYRLIAKLRKEFGNEREP
ncbi:RNA polymerase subunit sigma-24 [Bifidobacterium lemurum]|uniref:RNA polymerase subunit sigma-24 n=1 Tax=Bifidobacterium lemurum TaxID=1603886 RepID=A0A261FT46_9BIFI|nr:sigma-70 family RNA polymerase sigma factor [Bifidobacterium lemurum]OZG62258.1 RNA polymerase subunit sigma-24 [Bifidobacterium lemurum]QOL33627.1 sigma-70 family RNA polymerase sigma factor [Bifidobacterium lemurum]